MNKRFLFFLFMLCFMMGVIQAELNIRAYCNPIGNTYSTTNSRNPIQVIKEAPHFLILQFNLPELDIQQRLQNGKHYTRIQFDGSSSTTEVGKPKLPVYSVQIGMPSSSSVTTMVIQKQSTFKKVDSPPITNQVVDPLFPEAQEIYNITSESVDSNKNKLPTLYPDKLIEAIPVGFVRSQYIGVLHIHPVQYNQSTQQIKITNNITFRIDFYGAPPKLAAIPPNLSSESSTYENLFQTMLINNNQAYSWRQQQDSTLRRHVQSAPAAPSSNRRRFKIPITKNNM